MIEVMKQALEFIEETNKSSSFWMVPASRLNQTVNALRQAIAEAEKQEPAAIATGIYGGRFTYVSNKPHVVFPDGTAFYTHPQPKREPLTDEQVEKIIKDNMSLQMNLAGIRQDFEAAHGIKEKKT
jgi:hypothetical protein